jgi:Terminase large subunit, T4likevirus-type, N-terminal
MPTSPYSRLVHALDPVAFARSCGVEPDPWQADLLRSDARRALLLCSRQSGKSTTTGIVALWTALYGGVPGPIVIVSPSQRQSGEMIRGIRQRLAALDGGDEMLTGESVLKLEFKNGSRILALPGDERTIRGIAASPLVIIDEASRIEDQLIAGVRPMLATTNGKLIALTTPAGKRGWFYDAWHSDTDWLRIKVAASDCPRISAEFLAEEMKILGPSRYSEEYGLQFVDNAECAFPSHIVDRAFVSEVVPLWQ